MLVKGATDVLVAHEATSLKYDLKYIRNTLSRIFVNKTVLDVQIFRKLLV